jgi:hypothetical protein
MGERHGMSDATGAAIADRVIAEELPSLLAGKGWSGVALR